MTPTVQSESRFSTSVENEAWKRIADACELVLAGRAERLDGIGWKVYRAGTIIRIDLSPDFNPTDPRQTGAA